MNTHPRLQFLIASLSPELVERVAASGPGKEALLKQTFVVDEFNGKVEFPEGATFTFFAAVPADETKGTPAKPEYYHAKVGGTHIHLLDGLEPWEGAKDVGAQLRLRTMEPQVDRQGAMRNFEVVLRFVPATDNAVKRIVIKPADGDPKVTKVDADRGLLVHKGGYVSITALGQPRHDRIHDRDRSERW